MWQTSLLMIIKIPGLWLWTSLLCLFYPHYVLEYDGQLVTQFPDHSPTNEHLMQTYLCIIIHIGGKVLVSSACTATEYIPLNALPVFFAGGIFRRYRPCNPGVIWFLMKTSWCFQNFFISLVDFILKFIRINRQLCCIKLIWKNEAWIGWNIG